MHTTESDGALAPLEAVSWYAERGYGALALTDHLKVTRLAEVPAGLTLIPGVELHHREPQQGWEYHVVVLGERAGEPLAEYRYERSLQETLDSVAAADCLVFVAHPYRMGLSGRDLHAMRGALGVEVWNSVSERYGKALSTVIWDDLLSAGWRGWGLANDDTHWRHAEAGRGWTGLWVEQPDTAGILQALRAGRFFASNGPIIEALEWHGRQIHVRCSPCTAVRFIGTRWLCDGVYTHNGETISEASATMPRGTPYARVECVDAQGRVAWSNPIYFDV